MKPSSLLRYAAEKDDGEKEIGEDICDLVNLANDSARCSSTDDLGGHGTGSTTAVFKPVDLPSIGDFDWDVEYDL